jgi:hypothetical protein
MELAINQLIKILLGIVVIVVVISALFFFGSNISDFFKNLPGGDAQEIILTLLN